MSGSRGKGSEGPSEQCLVLAPSLAAFVEGALTESEAHTIAAHVAGCSWCAARVAAYVEVDALVREEPIPTPPTSLRAGVYAHIARIAAEAEPASHLHGKSEMEHIMREIDSIETPTVSAPPTNPSRNRSGPAALTRWIGPVAAVLVVALLASVFAALGRSRTSTAPTSTASVIAPAATATPQSACPPDKVQVDLPARTSLGDIAMTSPGTGWAVGAAADVNAPNSSYHTVIMRLSDCHWAPFGPSFPNAGLGSIAMVSPDEGWAAGGGHANTPLLLHYKGGTWSKVTPPPIGDIYNLLVVRALPSGEVWVAGLTPAGTRPNSGIALLHLAHGTWTRIETNLYDVSDIGPVGPGDAWIIGHPFPDSNGSNVAPLDLVHIQGGAVKQTVPLDPRDTLDHLRMLAPNDGWALGEAYVSGNETSTNPTVTRPLALHYDGTRWIEANTGVSTAARDIDVFGPGMAWSYTTAISQANGMELIVSTQREDAGRWTNVPWPYKDIQRFSRMTCVTPDDCWAIGSYTGPTVAVTGFGTLLLRYADGAWHEYGHS